MTSTLIRFWALLPQPLALAQQVVEAVEQAEQRLAEQVLLVVAQQVVVVAAAHRQAHAVLAVLAVMGSYLFMKYLHNESLRNPEQHRSEHHRAGRG